MFGFYRYPLHFGESIPTKPQPKKPTSLLHPGHSMPSHSPSANFVAPLKRTTPVSFWSPTN